ncbi:MAG: PEP-CTERM sorting domain-containing protein [Lacipirellulaceae bacterium]
MRLRLTSLLASVALALSMPADAALVSLGTFGNGDGWRAPNEIVTGDTAGTATGSNYNYLQVGNLERGMAYNPSTGKLVLVSRNSAGNGIRLLDGATGADVGFLSQNLSGNPSVVTGGTFASNSVGVAASGEVYVANLVSPATAAYKVYRWSTEAQGAPDVVFNAVVGGWGAGTPRLGDNIDVVGSGASTKIVAGASGVIGYAILDNLGVGTTTATAVPSFVPAGPAAGDFRIGVTFGATANDVIGKQTGGTPVAAPVRVTTYSGAAGAAAAVWTLTTGGEAALDYATIDGTPYLASVDANSSIVRVYSLALGGPVLHASFTSTSGTLSGNGNSAGSIKWGAISPGQATLYAMSTNQGIQALVFTVPEPASALLVSLGMVVMGGRRRR